MAIQSGGDDDNITSNDLNAFKSKDDEKELVNIYLLYLIAEYSAIESEINIDNGSR